MVRDKDRQVTAGIKVNDALHLSPELLPHRLINAGDSHAVQGSVGNAAEDTEPIDAPLPLGKVPLPGNKPEKPDSSSHQQLRIPLLEAFGELQDRHLIDRLGRQAGEGLRLLGAVTRPGDLGHSIRAQGVRCRQGKQQHRHQQQRPDPRNAVAMLTLPAAAVAAISRLKQRPQAEHPHSDRRRQQVRAEPVLEIVPVASRDHQHEGEQRQQQQSGAAGRQPEHGGFPQPGLRNAGSKTVRLRVRFWH